MYRGPCLQGPLLTIAEPTTRPRLSNRYGSPLCSDPCGVLSLRPRRLPSPQSQSPLQTGDIMNTAISALTRTARTVRRAITRLVTRLTRRAEIKVRISVSGPPFLRRVVDCMADLRVAANDNNPSINGNYPDKLHPCLTPSSPSRMVGCWRGRRPSRLTARRIQPILSEPQRNHPTASDDRTSTATSLAIAVRRIISPRPVLDPTPSKLRARPR